MYGCCARSDVLGVYPFEVRIHVDEVPFELGGVLNTTIALKGAKRVQVVHPKIRLEVRQASIMLCTFADGSIGPCALWLERTPMPLNRQDPLLSTKHEEVDPRCPKMPAARQEFQKLREDFPNILLYCQRNSYFDVRTFAAYFDDMLCELPNVPHVVVMDNAEGHFSAQVKHSSERRNVRLVATPAGCTDLCAATDAGLGRSVKLLMKNKFRAHYRANMDVWRRGNVSLADRRYLAMKWCSEAVDEFGRTSNQQIHNAHVRCGMALRFNGAENKLVKIDGYDGVIDF